MLLNVGLIGANGRMGLEIVQIIQNQPEDYQLHSALVAKNTNIASLLHDTAKSIVYEINHMGQPQVIIDFSTPKISLKNVEYCSKKNIAFILGTTGLSVEEKQQIENYATQIPILISANMSLSVNVLFKVAKIVSAKLSNFETEIVETHHRYKKDAPSGTAIKLGEMIANGRNISFTKHARYVRYGVDEKRDNKDIGFSTIRGGDVVGTHDALFFGSGEMLQLRSEVTNRASFAHGALLAAKFLENKQPGLYSMFDVLDL